MKTRSHSGSYKRGFVKRCVRARTSTTYCKYGYDRKKQRCKKRPKSGLTLSQQWARK